ncbi:IPT/TIG domain-containing protein [Hymenobacter koreensis]|uniref:IPT/TIG domain-containing protein n=1 Tax=Hymenobacter koreensis TaxID=1084523 RepID=A0ABP8J348_9BACT
MAVDDFSLTPFTAAPAPSLTATPATLSGFSTTQGTPSAEQSFALSGTTLNGTDVTLTPPANYELSLTSGSGFTTTPLVLTAFNGTSQTVYVRLSGSGSGAQGTAGTPVNITIAGGGDTDGATVALLGTVTVPVPAPTVTSFTPTSGPEGTVVTITGTDFNGATAVAFNGTAATTFSVTNATTISATVPAGATTGSIAVTTPSGTGTSAASFTVTAPGPVITGFSPASGPVGTVVTISGTNLSTVTDVAFGGTAATNVSATATTVTATVAAGTPAGAGAVVLSDGATTYTATGSFTVTAPPTVSTTAATAITFNSATTGGAFTNANGATISSRGVVYGTAPNPRIGGAGVQQLAVAGTASPFTANLTGLTPSTTYYVAAYVVSNLGTVYGADETFATTVSPLLGYDFESATNPDNPSTVAANVSGSAFSRTGVTANAGTGRFNSRDWAVTINAGKYVSFTFSPQSGYQATLTSLAFVDQRSASGNQDYEVRSSLDNFATALQTGTTNGGSKSIALTGFTNITEATPIEFRFYYAVSSTTSTYSVDNVNLFGTVQTAAPAPEIDVTQGGASLPSGTGSYSFPATLVGASSSAASFSILNRGNAFLILTANPRVQVTGANSADFTATQPVNSSIAPNGSQPFSITFTPSAAGTRTATIIIFNNDSNEGSYSFTVTGFGNLPPIQNPAPGTLVLEDDFNYPAGTDLTANGWLEQGAASPNVVVVAHNNAFTNYTIGAVDSTTSRRVQMTTGGQDVFKPFTLPTGATTLYASAIVRVTEARNGDYFLHFSEAGTTVFRGRVFIRTTTGGFQVGLATSGTATYSTQVFDLFKNYQVVLKYEQQGSSNTYSLYMVDGAATEAEPGVPLLTATQTEAGLALNAIALRQGGSSAVTLTLDGLRIATGWGAAVSRPIYTTPGIISAGNYFSLNLNNAGETTLAGPVNLEGALTLTNGRLTTNSTNLLTLYPAATVTGGSGTSFVSGPVARVTLPGAATALFPVGKTTSYRPVTLTIAAQTSTTTYTVEQTEGRSATQTLTGDLRRVSRMRYFTITPDAQPTGFSGSVTLSFEASDQVNDPGAASLVIARNGGSGWENAGRASSTGTANTNAFVSGTLTSGLINAFGEFALASTDADNSQNPLPVSLTAFTAELTKPGTLLRWATAQEKNNDRFEVLRSLDGREFSRLADVKGQGNTSSPSHYSYLDALPAAASTVYYRLRQVDFDGKASLSQVVSVSTEASLPPALYPNPATERVTLAGVGAVQWWVRNALGQVLLQGTAAGSTTLNVADLPAGVYYVETRTGARRHVLKLVKQ